MRNALVWERSVGATTQTFIHFWGIFDFVLMLDYEHSLFFLRVEWSLNDSMRKNSAALLRPLTDSKKKLGTDAKYIDAKFDYNQPTNDQVV